jgi:ectoine hydroxylase-related dioxygenase (phytanoyl-CoA dioxygenase family)
MASINELDLARMPFIQDKSFINLFMDPLILELTEKVIGLKFHLHLQNGIINRPERIHHQTSWHRDLPYQDWVSSRPLGFNAFICLTDFKTTNGATFVLPYSHRLDYFPSDKFVKENEVQVTAERGSVIFFDSMIYHRAGINVSQEIRYGINNMFVVPILRQQLDIASIADTLSDQIEVRKVLGSDFKLENSVKSYRSKRQKK